MKCTKIIMAAMMFAATTGAFAKAKVTEAKQKIVIVDRQGLAVGADIPAWVEAVAEGDKGTIMKKLKLDDDKQVFVFTANGPDLDFLKVWTDNVDVRAEVANSLSQAVAQSATATLQANQNADQANMNKALDQCTKALTALELNGLLKEAQYWMYLRRINPQYIGVKKTKKIPDSEYYHWEYTYYVVFSMDKAIYQTQIEAALAGVEDNASETELLKKALSQNLMAPLVPAAAADAEIEF